MKDFLEPIFTWSKILVFPVWLVLEYLKIPFGKILGFFLLIVLTTELILMIRNRKKQRDLENEKLK